MAAIDVTVGEHGVKIKDLAERQDKTDIILDKVRNRLPHYAVVIFACLTSVVAWLLKG